VLPAQIHWLTITHEKNNAPEKFKIDNDIVYLDQNYVEYMLRDIV